MPVEADARQGALPELVADRARLDPGAVALACDQAQVNYAELDELVRDLAAELAGRGVGAETPVGVCLERGIWSVVAPLAIWRAGGCYVPLDPRYPPPRLRFMAADAGLSLIITDPDTTDVTKVLAAGVGAGWMLAHAARPVEPVPDPTRPVFDLAGPGNLAYVIYTSGSTGTPKGVAVTRGELAAHMLTVRDRFGITAADRVLAFASFSFDASLEEFLPALISGAEVVIRAGELWTPAQFASQIRDRQLTVLNLPPLVLTELAAALEPGSMRSLRLLIVGDDVVPAAALTRWCELVPWTTVLNAYGPTEATVTASVYELAGPIPGRVPIGRPLPGRRIYVLDPNGQPVPPGVPGELFVGGAGMARGYLGRPGLTAGRFVPDPFAGGGARMYRTGDRARWLPDRNLDFLGRIDGQVKVRGFRVEPAEIEAVLTTHPGVASAAVTVREDRPGDQRLVGYVVPTTGSGIDSLLLRSVCARTLPPHMVPSAFVLLDALPLTPSGKVDRRALPEPQQDRAVAGVAFAAPDDGVEAIVADVWTEVLGLDRIGRHDDFFDLGGHSMLATVAAARLSRYLGLDVPTRLIFMAPTVAGFTRALGQRDGIPSAPPITPRDPALTAIPLSFAQLRMWLLANLQPDSNEYVVPAAFRVHGSLDVPALQEALADLAARHEILRTRIATGPDAEPVQVIGDPADRDTVGVRLLDLSGLADSAERDQAGLQAMRRAVCVPFDLAVGPLLRCLAIRLDDESWMLLFIFHHVVFDAWSARVFFRELAVFYQGRLSGTPAVLDPLPVQYPDVAVWQREWLAGDVLAERLGFWRNQLAGVGVLELPRDRPRPVVRSGRGAVVRAELAADVVTGLVSLGRGCGATLFMVLLAAFEVVLARWSGQWDVAVGTPVAGRERVETENLIGFFVNTLVMRTDLSGDPSFAGLVGRVRADMLDAFDHQDLPFEQLVKELRPERDLSRNPLFQVFFAYEEAAREGPVFGTASSDPVAVGLGTEKFDLSWTVTKQDTGITGIFSYSTDLFDEQTIVRLAGHMRRILEQVAANQDVAIGDLDLLDDAERSWLAAAAGEAPAAGALTAGTQRSVGALFGEQVVESPGAVAVVCGDRTVSYAELDELAEGLARVLAARRQAASASDSASNRAGDGEWLVGVCVRRGVWSVAAMLAVWRAGGVYVPLDPQYPEARLRFMVADAGVSLIITDGPVLELGTGCVQVDPDGLELPAEAAAVRANGTTAWAMPAAGELAYVIYTSGSTGRPKGVGVAHGELAAHVVAVRDRFAVTAADRVLVFASFCFDASLEQLLPALITGARVIIRPDKLWAPADLLKQISQHQITVLDLVPQYWAELVAGLARPGVADTPSLRLLVLGGEAMPSAPLTAWFEHFANVPIVNAYGPTETTVTSTTFEISRARAGPIPIGRPMPGRRAYVLDRDGALAPVGIPGELAIGGHGISRGYLNRPALTAEAFVPDPYGPPGGRMYRTGDRVRWLPDGNLDFLGRVDEQIKVRGLRIEPGEIEAALASCPAVTAAVVTARPSPSGDPYLVGYITGRHPGEADPQRLRDWCARSLPGYMIPSVFCELDAFPMTPAGKVDRDALPQPLVTGQDRTPPRTPTEEVIAAVWAEVLRLTKLDVNADFFALGGHSLKATMVASRLREVFDCPIKIRTIFENPTVARLATAVERLLTEQIAAMTEEEILASLNIDPGHDG